MPIKQRDRDGVVIYTIYHEAGTYIQNLNKFINDYGRGINKYKEGDQVEIQNSPGIHIAGGTIKSYRDGLYVRWCDGAKFEGMSIEAHATGIYLEWSEDILIQGCHVKNCGWKHKSGGGRRWSWQKREAIALDAVQDCQVRDCLIEDSSVGVAVFSNGGERGRPASTPAVGNIIRNNSFVDCELAIWLSSRAYRDYRFWEMSREGGEWVWNWKLPRVPFRNKYLWLFPESQYRKFDEEGEPLPYPYKITKRFVPLRLKSWIVPDWTWSNVETDNEFYGNRKNTQDVQDDQLVVDPWPKGTWL